MPVRPKSAGAAPQQSARTNSSGVQEIFSSSSEAFHVQDAFKKSINTSPACEGLASMSPQPLSGKHLELKVRHQAVHDLPFAELRRQVVSQARK